MNIFDILNSVNHTKVDVSADPEFAKAYSPFMINKGLSYFTDTIMYANEMNLNHNLHKDAQYRYFINTIRPKKRFSKWVKKGVDDDLSSVMEYYGYNINKAKSALSILSPDQLKQIRKKLDKGGENGK